MMYHCEFYNSDEDTCRLGCDIMVELKVCSATYSQGCTWAVMEWGKTTVKPREMDHSKEAKQQYEFSLGRSGGWARAAIQSSIAASLIQTNETLEQILSIIAMKERRRPYLLKP